MSRDAMTLIELLAALTLSAMLMAVLLAMLGQHSRINKRLIEGQPFEPWKTRLREQVESDYLGCRHVQIHSDRLVFQGYSDSGLGRSSGPSTITWSITPSEHGNLLFRERTDLLSAQTNRTHREFVCRGVNEFQSQTRLTTDVAPGILRISIRIDAGIGMTQDSSGKVPDDEAIELVLVRHGGMQ